MTTADGGNVVVVSLFISVFCSNGQVLPKSVDDGVVGSVSTSLFFFWFLLKEMNDSFFVAFRPFSSA